MRIFARMLRTIATMFALLLLLPVSAQQQQYRPDGRAFVCVNGKNRFTRALYGSPTEWRVETSDRPVFAVYKKKDCRNVKFRLNGVKLDEADYCQARYEDGMRSYVVRHKSWGAQAVLRLKVVASLTSEQALWRFQTAGFEGEVKVDVIVSNIRQPKLRRNGDLGADDKDVFEADGKTPVQYLTATLDEEGFVRCDTLTLLMDPRGRDRFEEAEEAMQKLAGRIVFNTPDPYINTLGGLVARLHWLAHAVGRLACWLSGRRAGLG